MADGEAAPRPESAGAIKPENRKDWAQKTNVNMSKARNLARDMLTQLRQNDIAEAANKMAAMENANREKEVKKKQVYKQASKHNEVIVTSFKCMQDIEEVILQTEDSVSKLRHEKYAGFASLQVCFRRLELRESRPSAETFQDKLSDALSAEKKLLEAARKEIEGYEAEGKQIIKEVMAKRQELSRDTGERRLEMAHDFSTLRMELTAPPPPASAALQLEDSTVEGGAEGGDAPASPSGAPTSPSGAPTSPNKGKPEAAKEEKKPEASKEEAPAEGAEGAPSPAKGDPKAIITETNALLQRAADFRQKSLQFVGQIRVEARRAAAHSDDCLGRRTHELAATKKKLEQHALDVDAAIVTAERALARTEKRLDPRDKKKKEKLDSDKNLLNQLRESRVILQEDIRNKFAALEIDNMCRRVTPAKADAAKRDKPQAQRSNSTPDLRAGAGAPGGDKKDQDMLSTAASSSMLESGAPTDATKLPPIDGAKA